MTESESVKIGGIVLAAGGSSRLGKPKQLLQLEGKTLLRRAAEAMSASMCDPAVVVLGAKSGGLADEIEGLRVIHCLNQDWRSGMGSSIRIGLAKLTEIEPGLDAVLISLCDQPFVTTEMLNRCGEKFAETKLPIVAAAYKGVTGVPALFSRELFGALSQLEGDKGARDLIRSRPDIATIDLPEAAFDIDTPEDAANLQPNSIPAAKP
ncbi:MAG: nucleotidyltransferase family protein [Pyrinomonadaceae bacterium]